MTAGMLNDGCVSSRQLVHNAAQAKAILPTAFECERRV